MKKKQLAAFLLAGVLAASAAIPAMAIDDSDLPVLSEDTADEEIPVKPTGGESYDPYDDDDDDYDVTPLSGNGTTTANVSFRSTPTSHADNKLGTIPAGTVVPVSLVTDSGWYKVTWNGQKGFIYQDYLVMGGTQASSSANDSDDLNDLPEIGTGRIKETAYFRSSPDKGDNIIGTISAGVTVDVYGETDGGWYKIGYKGHTGYVYHGLLEDSEVDSGTGTLTKSVNFRSTPDPDDAGNIIGGIPAGESVKVLEDTYNNWYKVVWNGKEGYVYGAYVDLS